MTCPICNEKTQVTDSRANDDFVRRRRACPTCKYRFSTIEIDEDLYERIVNKKENKQ